MKGFSDVDKLAFDKLRKVLGSLSYNSGTSRVTALFLHTKLMLLLFVWLTCRVCL